jgi:hypothetical protein
MSAGSASLSKKPSQATHTTAAANSRALPLLMLI